MARRYKVSLRTPARYFLLDDIGSINDDFFLVLRYTRRVSTDFAESLSMTAGSRDAPRHSRHASWEIFWCTGTGGANAALRNRAVQRASRPMMSALR